METPQADPGSTIQTKVISDVVPNDLDYTILNTAQLSPERHRPSDVCAEENDRIFFFRVAAHIRSTIAFSAAEDCTHPTYHGFIPISARGMADSDIQTHGAVRELENTSEKSYPLGDFRCVFDTW